MDRRRSFRHSAGRAENSRWISSTKFGSTGVQVLMWGTISGRRHETEFSHDRNKLRQTRLREGRYLLRTNLVEEDPAKRRYFRCSAAEKRGCSRAYVEDVAEAIVRVLRAPTARRPYELAGPRVYTYQELLRAIAASTDTRRTWSHFHSACGMSLDTSQKLCRAPLSPEIRLN